MSSVPKGSLRRAKQDLEGPKVAVTGYGFASGGVTCCLSTTAAVLFAAGAYFTFLSRSQLSYQS